MKEKLKLENHTAKKALTKAQKLGQEAADSNKLSQATNEVEKNLFLMKRGPIKKVWDKVLFLWESFKSPQVPLRLKITIIGALLYLILPLDVVPDALPGLGLVDDLSVILIVFREVSKYIFPKLEQKLEEKVYESCYQKIDKKLSLSLKSMTINIIWTFLANATGCFILVLKPFGMPASRYTAITIFILIFCWNIFRIIKYLIQYGKTSFQIFKAILKKGSISKGFADYVTSEYKYISYIYAGIEFVNSFIPEIPKIPDLPQIIKTFEKHYTKRLILIMIILISYSILIWLTKYFLLKNY